MSTALPLVTAPPSWAWPGVIFFLYVAGVALLLPGLPGRNRLRACLASAVGLAVCATAVASRPHPVLLDWMLPPATLLIAYWASGLLFVRPMPWAETVLRGIDRIFRVDGLAARAPRWLAELLEAAYLGVYALVPLALALTVVATPSADAATFWTVILVTDFVCFGMLPWVQTRPPRAFAPGEPWRSRLRAVNIALLGRTSIQVNTFPSGHAAEALAAALLVSAAPWPIVAVVGCCAVLVTAATVFGRYHYALDALAGWAVALVVWRMVV